MTVGVVPVMEEGVNNQLRLRRRLEASYILILASFVSLPILVEWERERVMTETEVGSGNS